MRYKIVPVLTIISLIIVAIFVNIIIASNAGNDTGEGDFRDGYNSAVINLINELQFCKPTNITAQNISFEIIALPCIKNQTEK